MSAGSHSDYADEQHAGVMVNEINMSQAPLDERLSNPVYHYYDKNLRKLTLATNTPHKRLDRAKTHHSVQKL